MNCSSMFTGRIRIILLAMNVRKYTTANNTLSCN